jgi:hypothetical protein
LTQVCSQREGKRNPQLAALNLAKTENIKADRKKEMKYYNNCNKSDEEAKGLL